MKAVEPLLFKFTERGTTSHDVAAIGACTGNTSPHIGLLDYVEPLELLSRLKLDLPNEGKGLDGVLAIVQRVLDNSANTWHPGFMDKLYASTNAIGVVSELILATLNTNVCLDICLNRSS